MKLLIFFLIFQAHAEVLDTFSCAKDVKKLSSQWQATGPWAQHYQNGLTSSFYAAPTTKLGEWVLTKKIPHGTVISKINQAGRVEASFTGKDCAKEVKVYTHPLPAADLKVDADIEGFVTKNKKGAIYVWSPRMTLSQEGIVQIQQAAAHLKLPLLVLLDKNVSKEEFMQLRKKLGSAVTERVDSLEFKMRNVGTHFPALLVFKDSKMLSEVKYGYEKSDMYQSDLVRMLSSGR